MAFAKKNAFCANGRSLILFWRVLLLGQSLVRVNAYASKVPSNQYTQLITPQYLQKQGGRTNS